MSSEISEASRGADPGNLPVSRKRGAPVSRADVDRARAKLRSQGKSEDLRSILAEVGRGSLSTIHTHVKALDEDAAQTGMTEPSALSPHITKALASEIDRLVKERTAHLAGRLEDATSSLDIVVEEAEGLRAAAAESAVQLDSVRASLAEQVGVTTALRSQAETFGSRLNSAREEAEDARQQLALVRAQHDASEEARSHAQLECSRLREEAAEIRRELQRTREELEAERRECIVLGVKLTAAAATETFLKQAAERAQHLQAELGDERSRLSASEAERVGLTQRLDDTRRTLTAAEATLQKLIDRLLGGQELRTPPAGLTSPPRPLDQATPPQGESTPSKGK